MSDINDIDESEKTNTLNDTLRDEQVLKRKYPAYELNANFATFCRLPKQSVKALLLLQWRKIQKTLPYSVNIVST